MTQLEPPRTDDREGLARLAGVLGEAGYTSEAVERELELDDLFARSWLEEPLYLRLLPRGERLSTLIELFLLGREVGVDEAVSALEPLALDRLERMGVVSVAAGRAQAAVQIAATEDFLVASDRSARGDDRFDHVMGFEPPTRLLARLTVLEPVEAALDVGTGSGYQALQAASVAREVVGVDVNPRALRFAEFNAALNGVPNVELREGSLFEPVAGERFGLIVCNPPYVISPETEFVFRDSGLPGDSFCEAFVRQLPEHLAEGGHGVALIAWVHGRGEDPATPVRRWVEGSGCDTLLFRYASKAPVAYAAGWNQNRKLEDDRYDAALDRWLDYYGRLGIEAIAFGWIVLRRRSSGASNWLWTHNPSSSRIGSASDQILRLFAAQDFLRSGKDGAALLHSRLALAEGHVFQESARLGEDLAGAPVALRLDGGFCFHLEIDGLTVALLGLLEGKRTVADAIEMLAASAPGVEPAHLAGAALTGIRRLIELGFLVPA